VVHALGVASYLQLTAVNMKLAKQATPILPTSRGTAESHCTARRIPCLRVVITTGLQTRSNNCTILILCMTVA
jgi:hypothetical protein